MKSMPAEDIAEKQRALAVCERMLAFEMDLSQKSNVLRKIGDYCVEILQQKNDRKTCEKAIAAYEEALLFYTDTEERHLAHRARVLKGLGYCRAALADYVQRSNNLNCAISHWGQALQFYPPAQAARDHAWLQNELGSAYRKLAELECRRENGKKAVEACEAALRVYNLKDCPVHYASAMANLASARLILAQAASTPAGEAEGIKRAISSYREAISVYSEARHPQQYAAMKNNLAIAYLTLSEVEDRAENCRKALAACKEALVYRRLEDQPLAYAALQNNLGNAYLALAEEQAEEEEKEEAQMVAEEEAKAAAVKKAGKDVHKLQADDIADDEDNNEKDYNKDNNGEYYNNDKNYNNYNNTNDTNGEDDKDNDCLECCRRALVAYGKALQVYDRKEHPRQYATAENNLANVYLTLAQREEPTENCMKAIRAATEALSVFSLKDSPEDYAEAQGSLWLAHLILAEIEFRAENCAAALDAAAERLLAVKEFGQPLDYASSSRDLAITATMLADLEVSTEAKKQDCERAIFAALEALRIYRVQSNPSEYAETQLLLWAAYSALAEVERSVDNCLSAISSCQAAIRVYEKTSPAEHAAALKNLGYSFITLAEIESGQEGKRERCESAIEAYESSLDYFTEERAPAEHADILRDLAYAYVSLYAVADSEECSRKALSAYKQAYRIYRKLEEQLEGQGEPTAHEMREQAEKCHRSMQSCKAVFKAGRRAKAAQAESK